MPVFMRNYNGANSSMNSLANKWEDSTKVKNVI